MSLIAKLKGIAPSWEMVKTMQNGVDEPAVPLEFSSIHLDNKLCVDIWENEDLKLLRFTCEHVRFYGQLKKVNGMDKLEGVWRDLVNGNTGTWRATPGM